MGAQAFNQEELQEYVEKKDAKAITVDNIKIAIKELRSYGYENDEIVDLVRTLTKEANA